MTNQSDPLKPDLNILIKLGSAMIHAEELLSPKWHDFDRHAFDQIVNDPEIQAWVEAMNELALLPVKR